MTKFEAIGTPKPDFAYYGDHPTWLVTLARTRDSDQIERSNWRFITSGMLLAYPDEVAIESMNHWAVGWVEYLLVDPNSPAVKIMSDWAEVLAIYPVADDEDYEALVAEEEDPSGYEYPDDTVRQNGPIVIGERCPWCGAMVTDADHSRSHD